MAKRLQVELNRIQKDGPAFGVNVSIKNDKLDNWEFEIKGPQGSPFEGKLIKGTVDFPSNYPHKAPYLVFVPPIYHVNVDGKSGEPCFKKLQDEWSPKYKMVDIFKELIVLIATPESGHAVRGDLGELYSNNIEEYNKRASDWAQKNLQPI